MPAPSKIRDYVRKYQHQHFATITANVPRPFKEQFRRICQAEGTTMHAVILELVAKYVMERE